MYYVFQQEIIFLLTQQYREDWKLWMINDKGRSKEFFFFKIIQLQLIVNNYMPLFHYYMGNNIPFFLHLVKCLLKIILIPLFFLMLKMTFRDLMDKILTPSSSLYQYNFILFGSLTSSYIYRKYYCSYCQYLLIN